MATTKQKQPSRRQSQDDITTVRPPRLARPFVVVGGLEVTPLALHTSFSPLHVRDSLAELVREVERAEVQAARRGLGR